MSAPPICPPEHKPIDDDEVAFVIVALYRTSMGNVEARSLHLCDEGEAHKVATLLASYGPTWLFDLEAHHSQRYGMGDT